MDNVRRIFQSANEIKENLGRLRLPFYCTLVKSDWFGLCFKIVRIEHLCLQIDFSGRNGTGRRGSRSVERSMLRVRVTPSEGSLFTSCSSRGEPVSLYFEAEPMMFQPSSLPKW